MWKIKKRNKQPGKQTKQTCKQNKTRKRKQKQKKNKKNKNKTKQTKQKATLTKKIIRVFLKPYFKEYWDNIVKLFVYLNSV